MTYLRRAHLCALPSVYEVRPGDVWMCDACGRVWRMEGYPADWNWVWPPASWWYRWRVRG